MCGPCLGRGAGPPALEALQARTPCFWRVPWRPRAQPLEGPLSLRLVNIRSILRAPPVGTVATHSGAQTWRLPLPSTSHSTRSAPTSPIPEVPDFLHVFPPWPAPPIRSLFLLLGWRPFWAQSTDVWTLEGVCRLPASWLGRSEAGTGSLLLRIPCSLDGQGLGQSGCQQMSD